ncbi:hydratase [Ventosimonas gracilis]|uniref:Hydratase n=1 Tax=Ventosimonas gracilis TaxID=1680762 RepID=A0A139SRV6_9GAMM|nr:nitrilase family protein [Ventosimonas gracilis]KXU37316.1 hydratase [Ventosimonas gracilis]
MDKPDKTTVQIACIQMQPVVGELKQNRTRSLSLIRKAAEQGAQLVVLPELANSGYMFASRQEAFALAEPLPDGETAQALIKQAEELGIWLVAGIAEHAGDRLYNSALVAGPRGYIGSYRKLHLWGEENQFFEPGDSGLPVFHTDWGVLGVAICYDGWFPEVYRLLALQGADVIAVPTNWVFMPGQTPESPTVHHSLCLAGAHSNGLVIASAARIGIERGMHFVGRSLIAGSEGFALSAAGSSENEEIIMAEVDIAAMRRKRQFNAFNHIQRDRRTDLYNIYV